MREPKPIQAALHQLTAGQCADFFAQLAEKSRGASRNGKPFFSCRFRDSLRTVSCMIWSDGPWFEACEKDWQSGQHYKLRANYQEHPTYGPQIELLQIRAVVPADAQAGFVPVESADKSRFDPDEMYAELVHLAESQIANAPLRKLVLSLLERHAAALKRLPATQRNFYPFVGGLLEHILSVTHTCMLLADKYAVTYKELKPPLNRDLLLAGAMLHDLGRVVELGDDAGTVQQTVPGRLFGHVHLGRDLVRDMARELGNVDAELVQLLEHMILSHLTLPEWGSPRLPMIPECLILHHADDLDAKLEMYARCLIRDQEPGPFTTRDPVLGKALLKGRKA